VAQQLNRKEGFSSSFRSSKAKGEKNSGGASSIPRGERKQPEQYNIRMEGKNGLPYLKEGIGV